MASIYHPGELAVQTRAAQREIADLVGKSIRTTIPPAAQEFLRSQPLAIIGMRDAGGRQWASLLTGRPGFMQMVNDQTVRIDAFPVAGDPLIESLAAGGPIGMIVIDFATRRRMRLNGRMQRQSDGTMYLHTEQVYANCPKYIQARSWERATGEPDEEAKVRRSRSLTERQRHRIREADTFFIASRHQDGGMDASHRGGNPGFVHVMNQSRLLWPDYSGNSMFQTLGNIAIDPHVGLLFMDFEGGGTLQLTGTARIVWDVDRAMEFPGAERLVEFEIEEVIELAGANPLRWRFLEYSPFNPAG
jgi:predicted pyridoxine 5'-phosphate oxidase superfamily flavin-nucleotide-binding protein